MYAKYACYSLILAFTFAGCSMQNSLVTEVAVQVTVESSIVELSQETGPLVAGVVFAGSGDDRGPLQPALSMIPMGEGETLFMPVSYVCFDGSSLIAARWQQIEGGGFELHGWEPYTEPLIGQAGTQTATYGFDQDSSCETFTASAQVWRMPDETLCGESSVFEVPFDSASHELVARSQVIELGEQQRVCYVQAETENPPRPPLVDLAVVQADIIDP